MPTSSQALILQTSTGDLPPLVQKTPWNQVVSFQYMPFTNNQTRKVTSTEFKQTLPGVFALRKSGSEPSLTRKYDFSTLSEILQIRRLGVGNTHINRADFFGMSARPRELAPIRRNVYTDKQLHVTHRNPTGRNLFIPDFRQSTETSMAEVLHKPDVYMRSKTDGDMASLEVRHKYGGDYFRLFEVGHCLNELGEIRTEFELEKSSDEGPGSFQIAPVGNGEPGYFHIIPPEGCETDIYRLKSSNTSYKTFQLLQRDPYEDNLFRTVETELPESSVRMNRSKMDIYYEGSILHSTTNQNHVGMEGRQNIGKRANIERKRNDLHVRSAENLAYNFEEVPSLIQMESQQNDDDLFPGICDSGYILKSALHNPADIDEATDLSVVTPDGKRLADDKNKNVDLMESIRNKSVDVYERLVSLGFRRANEDPEKVVFYENIRNKAERERQKYYGIDWKTDNVNQHRRPTEDFGMTGNTFSSLDSTGMILRQMFPDQTSFIEEIKPQLDHSSKKKHRKIKAVRMRKEIPPKDPNAVCISLRDNAISHKELKMKIEQETGIKVVSLQFDPISVHCPDPEVKSQWIVRFPNSVICEYLTKCGIDIGGVHYSVKSFDDVMQKEHNAFKLYTTIMDMKLRKTSEQKTKKVKQMYSSETQTLRLPQLKQITVL